MTRREADFYPTPVWVVDAFREQILRLPAGVWLEPSAGDGALIRAVNAIRDDVVWVAAELREEAAEDLLQLLDGDASRLWTGDVIRGDFSSFLDRWRPVVVFGNPPYSLVDSFLDRFTKVFACVVFLLRMTVLGSDTRAPLLRRSPPDIYLIPDRISFVGGGSSDSANHAWMLWPPGAIRSRGLFEVLPSTPQSIRKAEYSPPARRKDPLLLFSPPSTGASP